MDGWISRLLRQRRLGLAGTILVSMFGAGEAVEHWETLKASFNRLVARAVMADGKTHEVSVRSSAFVIVFLFMATWLIWLAFFIQAEVGRKSALAAKALAEQAQAVAEGDKKTAESDRDAAIAKRDERTTKAYKTMQGMMRAAALIRDQLVPRSEQPLKAFHSIKITFLISKDFVTDSRREYSISALNGPLHYWHQTLSGTPETNPADYLDDIDFKVRDMSATSRIVYLPTLNDPLQKKLTLYFLPQVRPGEAPRSISTSFVWPGYNRRLFTEGREELGFVFESASQIDLFKLEVYFEGLPGKALMANATGHPFTDTCLQEDTYSGKPWKGFVYTARNAPAGRNRFALTLELVDV